tara:strand:+ start:349 stop:636 length:288 start_codon:yes stop_codon:yes gene_type:complete
MLTTTINNNPKKAKDFDAVAAVAACHGYNVDGEIENGYIYATRFSKGNRRIWQCIDRRMGGLVWQTADLIDGYYRNHKKFKNLSLAFLRELNEQK